jgi:hypothetical protein
MHTLACVCYLYVQHLDVCVQNWHGGSFHLKWSSKQQSQNWKVRYPKGTRGGLGGEVQLVLTKCWRIMAAVGNCNNFQDINIFWPSASKSSFFKFHFTKCIKIFILQISFESLSMFKFIEVFKVLFLLLVFHFFLKRKGFTYESCMAMSFMYEPFATFNWPKCSCDFIIYHQSMLGFLLYFCSQGPTKWELMNQCVYFKLRL